MTIYEGSGHAFDLPNSDGTQTIDLLAQQVLSEVIQTVPYKDNGEYLPDRARKLGGGCCIAQALTGLEVARPAELPTGIVFGDGHAHFLIGQGDQVRFIDPLPTRSYKDGIVRHINKEAGGRLGYGLSQLYQKALPDALAKGSFIHYYYQEKASISGPWHLKRPRKIRGDTTLGERNMPHIIVDANRGRKMLCAIGHLARLKAKHQDDFPTAVQDRYDKLVKLIPDFIDPLAPIANIDEQ